MNRKVISVTLLDKDEMDILFFDFGEIAQEDYYVNLNSPSSQNDLKRVFSKLLEVLIENDITLKLEIKEGYAKGLYKEVCQEYIKDLNVEIKDVKEAIERELT